MLLISSIIGQTVLSLVVRPQEYTIEAERSNTKYTIYRVDFTAQIENIFGAGIGVLIALCS